MRALDTLSQREILALAILVEMTGAVLTMNIHIGFFINWMGHQKGKGYEYHLVVIALAFLIMVRCAGTLFIDYTVFSRNFREIGNGNDPRTSHDCSCLRINTVSFL